MDSGVAVHIFTLSSHKLFRRLRTFFNILILLVLFGGHSATLLRADSPSATITQPSGAMTVWAGVPVTFSGTSDTTGTYSWDFGDGTTGAGANTTHPYATPAVSPTTYTAKLTVTWMHDICKVRDLDGGCKTWQTITSTYTATRSITVWAKPVIGSFSANASSVEVGRGATLTWATTNATSLALNGSTVTGTSAVVYPTGTTAYTLTATNPVGSVTSSLSISTYTLTVAINPGTTSILLGGTQAFSGSVTPANQGVIWSTSGGTLSGSTNTATTFTGTASGTYSVKITSIEDTAKSATATVTVLPASVATPVANPANATTFVGGTVGFTAQVGGAVNTGVSWSVSGGGTINANTGVFTASTKGDFTVTATSLADPTKTATAPVHVVSVVVTTTPNDAQGPVVVKAGTTSTPFSATVTGPGSPSQAVTWSVVETGGGSAAANGAYTAPAISGNYTLRATSVQDVSCFKDVKIRVPGWVMKWKRDLAYFGTKEVAEFDGDGIHVTHVDHLGSPRLVTGTNGKAESAQKYMPFGETLDQLGTMKTVKGFTNHEQTDGTGLVYMQARFYAPQYHRFLSPDPARDQHFEATQSWNIYSYVQNMPLMKTDPTGMEAQKSPGYDGMSFGGYSGDSCCASAENLIMGYGNPSDLDPAGNPVAAATQATTDVTKKEAQTQENPAGTTKNQWTAAKTGATFDVTPEELANRPKENAPIIAATVLVVAAPIAVEAVVAHPTVWATLTSPFVNIWNRLFGSSGAASTAGAVNPDKLAHLFDNASHGLDPLVNACGGSREQAFRGIQTAANLALDAGKLQVGPNGILPGGQSGAILNINGVNVQMVGGRVINGVVEIGSVSRRFLNEK